MSGRPAGEALAATARSLGAQPLLVTTTRSLAGPGGPGDEAREGARPALCRDLRRCESAHAPRGRAGRRRPGEGSRLRHAGRGGWRLGDRRDQDDAACLWGNIQRCEKLDRVRAGPGADRLALARLEPAVRMVAMPTTLSAAEFTPFAGATDAGRRVKEGYSHALLAPRVVVLDPAVTRPHPSSGSRRAQRPSTTRTSSCAIRSARRSPMPSRETAWFASVGGYTRRRDPHDLEARLECQFGMWLAISGASSGGGMGASHAIGWITGRFDPPFRRLQMNFAAPHLDVTDVDVLPRPHCPCRRIRGWADQAGVDALITAPDHWRPVEPSY